MENLLRNLTYSLRMLLRAPTFTSIAILTLALGIGVNASVFILFNAVMYRDLPVQHPETVVNIFQQFKGKYIRENQGSLYTFSAPEYEVYRTKKDALEDLAAFAEGTFSLGSTAAKSIDGLFVSDNYFRLLGARLAMGRDFLPEEWQKAVPVAVLSFHLWQTDFLSDPAILGKTVVLNQTVFTVVGVSAQNFVGTEIVPPDVWIPFTVQPTVIKGENFLRPNVGWLNLVGRLKPGMSSSDAQAAISAYADQLDESYPGRTTRITVRTGSFSGDPEMRTDILAISLLTMLPVALLFLVCCTNIINLLLVRASEREKEVALRLALGAGRSQIFHQLLSESIIVALVGGLVAFILVSWSLPLLLPMVLSFMPTGMGRLNIQVQPDIRVIVYTLGLSILAGIVCGFVPAYKVSKKDLFPLLKDGVLGATRTRSRFQNNLIVAQVCVCLTLLFGGNLMLIALRNLTHVNPGFDISHIVVGSLQPAEGNATGGVALSTDEIGRRVSAMPGITSVAWAVNMPLESSGITSINTVRGDVNAASTAHFNVVSPSYFTTLGIPLVSGRIFNDADSEKQTPVAVIDEAMARRFWPRQDALGKQFEQGSEKYEVIGVVRTVRSIDLSKTDDSFFYRPLNPQNWKTNGERLSFFVRTSGDPHAMMSSIQKTATGVYENSLANVRPMAVVMNRWVESSQLRFGFVGISSSLGLLLVAVGTYGIVSYAVSQRRQEFAMQIALGAQKRNVIFVALRHTMRLVLIGIGIGVLVSIAMTRLMSNVLPGVPAEISLSLAIAAFLLLGIALAACWVPARNAASVDPIVALRHEA
jgi:macrolide transport system ATP-binding/permease protein